MKKENSSFETIQKHELQCYRKIKREKLNKHSTTEECAFLNIEETNFNNIIDIRNSNLNEVSIIRNKYRTWKNVFKPGNWKNDKLMLNVVIRDETASIFPSFSLDTCMINILTVKLWCY